MKKWTIQAVHTLLEDVMEIIDHDFLSAQLNQVEKAFRQEENLIHKIRLAIVYHEVALNFGFFDSLYKGYPKKALDLFDQVLPQLTDDLKNFKPFVLAYQASALSLLSGETKKLGYLSDAFRIFESAVQHYGHLCYAPEFMRGSVAENLPWFLFKKRGYAKKDFTSIIDRYERDPSYASDKIMSFTYWAWANQHQSKKYRMQAIHYLEKAIVLDPNYRGGRQRAEELLVKLK